jgi:hypothetical protein
MQDQKHILVICSSPSGVDFNFPVNQQLKSQLFGHNPIYTFCNGPDMMFPEFPIYFGQQYDFIWFAGCNLILNIFPVMTNDDKLFNQKLKSNIDKLKQILKPNGYLFFTEAPKLKMKYGLSPDQSLTVLIDFINNHEKVLGHRNEKHREKVVRIFKKNFIEVTLGNHSVYRMKSSNTNMSNNNRNT